MSTPDTTTQNTPSALQKSKSRPGEALTGEVLKAGVDDGLGQRPIPAVGQLTVVEDPLAEFLRAHWRKLAIILAVAAAIFYGMNVFRATQITASQSSGDSFVGLQRTFNELQEANQRALDGAVVASTEKADEEKQKTERAALEKRLESQLKSLSFAKTPYPGLAAFYATLAKISGDGVEAEAKLARESVIKSASFRAEPSGSIERLTAELLFLAAARSSIDADINAARLALEALADSGEYAAGSAAKTLSRIASTTEEQARAKVVAEQVLARKPELAADFEQD